jgi:hypothetical protein
MSSSSKKIREAAALLQAAHPLGWTKTYFGILEPTLAIYRGSWIKSREPVTLSSRNS